MHNTFEFRWGFEVHWLKEAFALFNEAGLVRHNIEQVEAGLKNSTYLITSWESERLVGIARILTDGAMYASIFDVAVLPSYQKRGIGREMMQRLMERVPNACVHLTSTFGHEAFYRSLGFKSHKTAMALYPPRLGKSPYLEKD